MEPQEYMQLIEKMREDATQRTRVLAQAAAAKQKEIEQISDSGHITDDKPTAQPVYTVQDELESWEKIIRALTEIHTELERSRQRQQGQPVPQRGTRGQRA